MEHYRKPGNYPHAPAAAPKSLQSCPTLCSPIDGRPPSSPVPGILQARTLEWIAISFSNALKWKVKGKSLSCVRLFATTWTAAHQVPPSMGFSRQEYWSGVPLPSPTPCTYCPSIYDKGGIATQCQIDSLSTNDAVNTGQLNVTKMKLDHPLTSYIKINSKWIRDLKCETDTIKFLKENVGRTVFDINSSEKPF